ncbi:MAG: glycoside hydrolase family 3 N-terminal domain-containing protein [Erythrobacter sp.]
MRYGLISAAGIALATATVAQAGASETQAPSTLAAASDHAATAEALLARMSLERKVAQLVMPDIASITPEDVRRYRFGTILNGGNSGPGGDDLAPAPEWLKLADAMWEASSAPLPAGEPAIPALWATDAVHGHNNLGAATIFPHNIGLGATRDAELMQRIGKVTAAEIAVTGIDWTFAPTLAVVTDDRWGRTYESFSQDPALVAELGRAMVLGLQGAPGKSEFLDETRVIATAKHFFGDGGTGGLDRGDTRGDPEELYRIHASPYPPSIAAGVQSVMASFSSVNGAKMHGSTAHLTDILRGEMGFDGLVVGDWNGHGELAGCSNTNCPQSLLAGLDVYMVPEDWKGLYENLLVQVKDGTIPMARLDEAVRRVLLVKLRYGLLGKPKPSARALGGKWELLGAPEHRAVAREAVRKSLVLLKNEGVLPLKPSANVLVAGTGADSIPLQSGGWSITWQGGGDLTNADFPGATSIYAGIAEAVQAGGGAATLSPDGSYDAKPDAAIVIFGEQPYAEFVGDREDLAFRDEEGLRLLRQYRAAGISTIAVFLSGRAMWVNRELAEADAFVAAWLPGSEGAGIADVLIADRAGQPRHDFTGKLAFDWPAGCAPGSPALAPFGFGSSYAAPASLPPFDDTCALLDPDPSKGLAIFTRGLSQAVAASADGAALGNLVGKSRSGALAVSAFDIAAQEDGRRLRWSAPAALSFAWNPISLPETAGLTVRYRLEGIPTGTITLTVNGADTRLDLTSSFNLGAGKGWRTMQVPLACLGVSELGGITIASDAAFEFELESLALVPQTTGQDCRGPF